MEGKFISRFCKEKHPFGMPSSGQIKISVTDNSAQGNEEKSNGDKVKFSSFDGVRKRSQYSISGSEAASGWSMNSSYCLRVNPKRTLRFVDSNTSSQHHGKFCPECSKGFPSTKALHCHMACHSEKEKETIKLDDESMSMGGLNVDPNSASVAKGFPFSSLSVVEEEQEEVARCLMMLSENSTCTNSFVSKAKLLSVQKRLNTTKKEQMDVSCNSGSGYYRNDSRKVKLDVSEGEDSKMPQLKRSGFETYDTKFGRAVKGLCYRNTDLKKSDTRKRTLNGYGTLNPDSIWASKEKIGSKNGRLTSNVVDGHYDSSDDQKDKRSKGKQNMSKNVKKKGIKKSNKHECPYCYKVFKSGQALGGHKRSHFIGSSVAHTVIDLNLPAPVDE